LFDLGGNVWEWCLDWHNAEKTEHVARGASYVDFSTGGLRSSVRGRTPNPGRANNFGFRAALEKNGKPKAAAVKPTGSPTPASTPAPVTPMAKGAVTAKNTGEFITAAEAEAKVEFTNSLGMRFVKVPGTKVLMCIHETRHKDYAAYAAAVPGLNEEWKKQTFDGIVPQDADNCPVFFVNWDDCQGFCTWLSQKEGRIYRMPSDEEWSFAVGIGRQEQRTKNTTPRMLAGGFQGVYPWGTQLPPPAGAGNFSDESRRARRTDVTIVEGYNDGVPTVAPVMSFLPNKLGIYDLAGNVYEFCLDWDDQAKGQHVKRGGCWDSNEGALRSAGRYSHSINIRGYNDGFRMVVESKNLP
jgi:formylglycine-generating enzyme required for sulfatase activity